MTQSLVATVVFDPEVLVGLMAEVGLPTEDVGESGRSFTDYATGGGEFVGIGNFEFPGKSLSCDRSSSYPATEGRRRRCRRIVRFLQVDTEKRTIR